MSENVKVNNTGGIGFAGLLTIVFITLKLTGYIDWSWWWVLAPIWIPIVITLLIILAFVAIAK
jgi:hypothetical protein